jgi:hypothetical protein
MTSSASAPSRRLSPENPEPGLARPWSPSPQAARRMHGHDPRKCDLVVCWKHDWAGAPAGLRVLELRKLFGRARDVFLIAYRDEFWRQLPHDRTPTTETRPPAPTLDLLASAPARRPRRHRVPPSPHRPMAQALPGHNRRGAADPLSRAVRADRREVTRQRARVQPAADGPTASQDPGGADRTRRGGPSACGARRRRAGDPALAPWEGLLPELRASNNAQVDDVPNKLDAVGLCLQRGGQPFEPGPEEVELWPRWSTGASSSSGCARVGSSASALSQSAVIAVPEALV